MGVLVVLGRVTLPQLAHARWRTLTQRAGEVLREAAAGARAHFVRHGSYRCGACGASVPTGTPFTYVFAAPAAPTSPCLALPPLAEAGGDGHGFRLFAVRPLGAHACEVGLATADGPLRWQRWPLGARR